MQLQQNLMGDMYSGYMTPPTPFGGTIVNNETYALNDGWNTFPGTMLMAACGGRKSRGAECRSTYPEFVAWARILKVEAMHRVSDIYGPVIYTKYGSVNADGSVSYDSQKRCLLCFFQRPRFGCQRAGSAGAKRRHLYHYFF